MKCQYRNCKEDFVGEGFLERQANHYEFDHNKIVIRKYENSVLVRFSVTDKRCNKCDEVCICNKCKNDIKCCPCHWEK